MKEMFILLWTFRVVLKVMWAQWGLGGNWVLKMSHETSEKLGDWELKNYFFSFQMDNNYPAIDSIGP